MSEKYLIVGATGSIGSNLATQLYDSNKEVHLVGRKEDETKSLSEKLGFTYTIADVLEDGFVDKIKSDVKDIKGFQDSLKKNNGSIVLFSTIAAQKGFTNHSIIASAKAAVEGLALSIAAEFAPDIRVNCVALSLTNSKIAQPILKNTVLAQGIAKSHPLKRIGEGKDGAAIAKFLLTEESSWMTGQVIAVDGGRSKLS